MKTFSCISIFDWVDIFHDLGRYCCRVVSRPVVLAKRHRCCLRERMMLLYFCLPPIHNESVVNPSPLCLQFMPKPMIPEIGMFAHHQFPTQNRESNLNSQFIGFSDINFCYVKSGSIFFSSSKAEEGSQSQRDFFYGT